MKRIAVISLVFTIVLILANTFVYASDINLNLDPNSSNVTHASNSIDNEVAQDFSVYGSPVQNVATATTSSNNSNNANNSTPKTTQGSSSYEATVSVGSTAGISSSSLSLSNTLNIILIVLGILMVLFAIAILIRMH